MNTLCCCSATFPGSGTNEFWSAHTCTPPQHTACPQAMSEPPAAKQTPDPQPTAVPWRRREYGFAGGVSSTARDFGNGHHIQHQSLQVTLFENCKYREATPPKICLLNCLKLNLKCMYAVFLSARYSELLLWPYDKRMQEIIANLPPARKRELITASTKSALFQ